MRLVFAGRMFMTPGYSQDAHADNVKVFHGREIRQVPNAAGGMGFVLQLSMAEGDPEGWTAEDQGHPKILGTGPVATNRE
jgi:hypothetical protein